MSANLLFTAWIACSLVLIFLFVVSQVRLHVQRCGWVLTLVDGTPVWVSSEQGPAVVGVFSPQVVLPVWALDLPEDERRLMIAHEREHVRAGDMPLLMLALATVVVVPWNVGVWLCVLRLRRAVEFDCDMRVLRSGVSRRAYVELLLGVAARRPAAAMLALAAGRSRFARRVEQLVTKRLAFSAGRVSATSVFAMALVAAAMLLPANVRAVLPSARQGQRAMTGPIDRVHAGAGPMAVGFDPGTGETLAIVRPGSCEATDPRYCEPLSEEAKARLEANRQRLLEQAQRLRSALDSARARHGALTRSR